MTAETTDGRKLAKRFVESCLVTGGTIGWPLAPAMRLRVEKPARPFPTNGRAVGSKPASRRILSGGCPRPIHATIRATGHGAFVAWLVRQSTRQVEAAAYNTSSWQAGKTTGVLYPAKTRCRGMCCGKVYRKILHLGCVVVAIALALRDGGPRQTVWICLPGTWVRPCLVRFP